MNMDEFAEALAAETRRFVAESLAELRAELKAQLKTALAQALADMHEKMESMVAVPLRSVSDLRASMELVTEGMRSELRDSLTERATAIQQELKDLVAAIPKPRDGKDADIAEIGALVRESVERAVAALPARKEAVGLTGGVIDQDGHLLLTLSDGRAQDVGRVVGRDAEAAEAGKPGRDGFGFEDLSVEFDGERTMTLVFTRGEERKAFPVVLPIVLDRGVYRSSETYAKGDGVTWSGSFWIAQRETDEKPGEGATGWRLAVKQGSPGKNFGTLAARS